MRVCVETSREGGTEVPFRLHLDVRSLDIADVIDRWYGEDYCYFKVQTADGDTYILRFDEERGEWALTMFRTAQPHAVPREFQSNKRPATALTM